MRRWTISTQSGWLRIDSESSIDCVEAERVTCFGTTRHGFVVNTGAETLFFESAADHARDCVQQLWDLLAAT